MAEAPPPVPEPEAAPEPPPEPEPVPEPPQQRQTLDPALRSILQEEAEREARLRQAEAGAVETQAEMSLGATPADTRRAELDSAPDAFDPGPVLRHGGQTARDLFPDIDEINSTLRDTADRSGDEPEASDIDTLDTLPRRRFGSRIGFFTVVLAAAAALVVYVYADRMAAAVPGLAPSLGGYVDMVDGVRFWLDDMAQGLGGDTSNGG